MELWSDYSSRVWNSGEITDHVYWALERLQAMCEDSREITGHMYGALKRSYRILERERASQVTGTGL